MSRVALDLMVNGELHQTQVEPHWTLLHVLRNVLGFTGTKENCLEAECGVCTVLVEGTAVASCILLALQCVGARITTIEGLAPEGALDPLQEAFIQCGAVQCGYCIPGMILTAKSFLDERPGAALSDAEIREGLCGTLCRCTGYQKIVEAVASVASSRQAEHAR
jgi:carbon-monoxide dehydrogenase small subunit